MFAATNFRTVCLRQGKHQSIKIAIKGVLIESILLPSILIEGNYFSSMQVPLHMLELFSLQLGNQ